MKKLTLLTMTIAFFSLLSHAQFIEKDKRILGGSIGLGFSNINDSIQYGGNEVKRRSFSVALSPSYGKAIKPNFVFGYYADLGVNSDRLEFSQAPNTRKANSYSFGGGLFLEKFFPLSDRLAVSGRLSGGAGYSNSKWKDQVQNTWVYSSETRSFRASLSLAPSLNYKLTQKLLVGLSANDFLSVNYSKGSIETIVPNNSPKTAAFNSLSAGAYANTGKSIWDFRFSFRFLL